MTGQRSLTRLMLDQLDKHAVLKVMGKTAQRLLEDNR